MSRTKDNYENSLWLKFKKWIDGETDLLADGMEIRVPEEDSKVLTQAAQSAQAELPGDDQGKAARMRKKEELSLIHIWTCWTGPLLTTSLTRQRWREPQWFTAVTTGSIRMYFWEEP